MPRNPDRMVNNFFDVSNGKARLDDFRRARLRVASSAFSKLRQMQIYSERARQIFPR